MYCAIGQLLSIYVLPRTMSILDCILSKSGSATLCFGCSSALAALVHRFECVLALSIFLRSSGCAVLMQCRAYTQTETVPA